MVAFSTNSERCKSLAFTQEGHKQVLTNIKNVTWNVWVSRLKLRLRNIEKPLK
jgi:hypothetical protein